MKGKSTKSALLMSFTSLLLCFAMLIGCTFAWFTDSVTSGVNKIQAGNLDIEVEYKNQASGGWNNLEGSQTVFSQDRWEPGHTEFVTLKITNKGTLALKYQMMVTPVTEKGGINKAGESFKLSEYLVFGTTAASTTDPNYADRAAARAAATVTNGLSQPILAGLTQNTDTEMAPNDIDYITLVVYMPESVGNEANYKTGTTAPEIELGIKFIATQLGSENESTEPYAGYVESDSFGKDYDNGVNYPAIDTVVTYNYFPQTEQVAQLKKSTGDNPVAQKDGEDGHVNDDGSKITIKSDAKVNNDSGKPFAELVFNNNELNFTGEGTEPKATVTFTAEKKSEGNITVASGGTEVESVTYDIKAEVSGGSLTGIQTVRFFIGAGKLNVSLTHKGATDVEMTAPTTGATPAADTFTYDSETGYVTMYVDHFSDFVAQYNAPVAAVGTTACYSLAQAAALAGGNTKVDLIRDVKTAETVENITLNLNGKTVEKLTVTGSANIQDTTGAETGEIKTLDIAKGAVVTAPEETVTTTSGDGKDNIAYTDVKPAETEAGEAPVDPKYCATAGDMSFTSLNAAFMLAKSGSTVTMLKDITSYSTLTVSGKTLTLDLNGNTLTVNNNDGDGIVIENGADLTLSNSVADYGKYIFNTTSIKNDGIFVHGTNANDVTKLTVQNPVKIQVNNFGNSAIHAYGESGKAVVDIEDGTNIDITRQENRGQWAAVQCLDNAEVNMKGGRISLKGDFSTFRYNNDAVGIMAWGNGAQVNVSGGEFSMSGKNAFAQGIQIGDYYQSTKNATVNVSGGTFDLSASGEGEAYAFTACYPDIGQFNVSGCTVTGTLTDLAALQNSGKMPLTITGGTFSADPSAYLAQNYSVSECTAQDGSKYYEVVKLGTVDYTGVLSAEDILKNTELTVTSTGTPEMDAKVTVSANAFSEPVTVTMQYDDGMVLVFRSMKTIEKDDEGKDRYDEDGNPVYQVIIPEESVEVEVFPTWPMPEGFVMDITTESENWFDLINFMNNVNIIYHWPEN